MQIINLVGKCNQSVTDFTALDYESSETEIIYQSSHPLELMI